MSAVLPASGLGRSRSFEVSAAPQIPTRGPAEAEAWIGFGTNLGDRLASLQAALLALGASVEQVSPIYETAPWGLLDQPWFLNGVARLRWTAGPEALLERCLAIERDLGRVRYERNGPRIIDLDVLVWGPELFCGPGLTVPHPGIASRRSVLEPWADLSPELVVPGLGLPLETLRSQAQLLAGQHVRPFAGDWARSASAPR
jgi:2-amino-4-hydroxy-6-hydroxymethyldihydropteridine diphosphokinase